jgi:hypothetical protein
MAIPVTTRSGKGSALTQNEMDTNLTNLARDATETQQGNVELATNAETATGTATDLAVHPAGLQSVLNTLQGDIEDSGAFLAANNGYVQLPDWLGNVTFQWGNTNVSGNGTAAVSFPVTFASVFQGYAAYGEDLGVDGNQVSVFNLSTTGMTIRNSEGNTRRANWWAVGTGNQP